MKPQPRPRKPVIPKATGPDPAALTTTHNTSNNSHARHASDNSHTSDARHDSDSRVGRISLRGDTTLFDELRGAWRHVTAANPDQGLMGFGPWVCELLRSALIDLRQEHNQGQPFPRIPPGNIPHSRR